MRAVGVFGIGVRIGGKGVGRGGGSGWMWGGVRMCVGGGVRVCEEQH